MMARVSDWHMEYTLNYRGLNIMRKGIFRN